MLLTLAVSAQAPAAFTGNTWWIDVPFVQQTRDGCGAAALSMLMQYWAHQQGTIAQENTDAALIQSRLYSAKNHGIPAAAMQSYLQQNGYQALTFHGQWSDLEAHLQKGRPLIAAIRPQGQRELHYVVIDGVDSAHDLVTMNDPAERKLLTEERARFEKDWSATGNWTLLAVPASPVQ